MTFDSRLRPRRGGHAADEGGSSRKERNFTAPWLGGLSWRAQQSQASASKVHGLGYCNFPVTLPNTPGGQTLLCKSGLTMHSTIQALCQSGSRTRPEPPNRQHRRTCMAHAARGTPVCRLKRPLHPPTRELTLFVWKRCPVPPMHFETANRPMCHWFCSAKF